MTNKTSKKILLSGWDFSNDEYIHAHKNQKLLTAQIETSNLCNLNCIYCFREEYADSLKTTKKLKTPFSVTSGISAGRCSNILPKGSNNFCVNSKVKILIM